MTGWASRSTSTCISAAGPSWHSAIQTATWKCSQYTASGPGRRLMLLLHHDDAEREYAYDRKSKVGRLDKAWDEAINQSWLVVSMKRDFKTVFAFQK